MGRRHGTVVCLSLPESEEDDKLNRTKFAYPQLFLGITIENICLLAIFYMLIIFTLNVEIVVLICVSPLVLIALYIAYTSILIKSLSRFYFDSDGIVFRGKNKVAWENVEEINLRSMYVSPICKAPIGKRRAHLSVFVHEVRPIVEVKSNDGKKTFFSMSDENMSFLINLAQGKNPLVDDLIEYYTEKKENGELPPHWEEVGLFKK